MVIKHFENFNIADFWNQGETQQSLMPSIYEYASVHVKMWAKVSENRNRLKFQCFRLQSLYHTHVTPPSTLFQQMPTQCCSCRVHCHQQHASVQNFCVTTSGKYFLLKVTAFFTVDEKKENNIPSRSLLSESSQMRARICSILRMR